MKSTLPGAFGMRLIITETGLRAYKELSCMKKEQVHTANKLVFIADSKTPT